jgi:hypothetical protein
MRLHRPNGDDVAGNRVNGDVPGSLGTSSSAGRRLPLLGRAGVGALLAPAADLGGVGAATSQRWRAYCKRWPIPPAPDSEAAQDRVQGRLRRVAARRPLTTGLGEDSTASIEGMARAERCLGASQAPTPTGAAAPAPAGAATSEVC